MTWGGSLAPLRCGSVPRPPPPAPQRLPGWGRFRVQQREGVCFQSARQSDLWTAGDGQTRQRAQPAAGADGVAAALCTRVRGEYWGLVGRTAAPHLISPFVMIESHLHESQEEALQGPQRQLCPPF